jgi:ATP-binding cassette subfamily F protein 3
MVSIHHGREGLFPAFVLLQGIHHGKFQRVSFMLTAHHLYKSYNINPILQDISFSINPAERVGLIGPNGCGKTTLLRIIAGQEAPDRGLVTYVPSDLRIGYMQQGFEPDLQVTITSLIEQAIGNLQAAEADVERLALAYSEQPERRDLQDAYDAALQHLQVLSQADTGRIPSILSALGLSAIRDDQPVGTLSGGQKTRLALALVLIGDPQLLLLDEPTNHLDIEMLEWLENWLQGFPGAALIVSHDRTFLDHSVNRILDLNPDKHTVREYSGNYSQYLEQYQAGREKQMAEYRDQVYEIRRMKQDIARTKQQSQQVEASTTSRQPGVRRIAKKVAKKALSREKKLERYIESDERVEKVQDSWQMKSDFLTAEFGAPPRPGQDVLILEDLSVGYAGYPALLSGLNLYVRAGRRVAISGPNGAGKTTLLRTIAAHLPPVSGRLRLGANVHLGYMAQEQEILDPARSALESIQRVAALNDTDARAFLHYFLFTGDDPLRPSRELSFGERARLSLALLVAQGCNFLLLDEPINHLDIPSRTRFEQALANFEGTVLAVVHDRYFIERFADEVWQVSEGSVALRYN